MYADKLKFADSKALYFGRTMFINGNHIYIGIPTYSKYCVKDMINIKSLYQCQYLYVLFLELINMQVQQHRYITPIKSVRIAPAIANIMAVNSYDKIRVMRKVLSKFNAS